MRSLFEKVRRAFGGGAWDDAKRRAMFAYLAVAGVLALVVAVSSPLQALALAVAACTIALVLYRPDTAVVLLAAYTPFEPFLLKFVPDELYVYARYFSEGLIYVLVLSVALRILLGRKTVRGTPIDVPFLLFVLTAITSLVLNAVPVFSGILGLRQIIRFILLFFVIVYLAPSTKFIRAITVMMGCIVVLQSLLGLAQSVTAGALDDFLLPSQGKYLEGIQLTAGTDQFWSEGTRIFATFGRYDQLGTFLCFFLLFAVGLLYFTRSVRERWALIVLGLVALPALALTLSRASWFGFFAGVLVISGWYMRDRRVQIGALLAVVFAVGYVAYSGLVVRYLIDTPEQTLVERFFEAFSYERFRGEYYGLGRVYWIANTPLVVATSPVFGVGPSMYGGGAVAALRNTKVYEQLGLPFGVYGTEGYIDNNWFSLWGETGTLGLAMYVWMFIGLWRMSVYVWKRSHSPEVKGLALGYVGVIVAVTIQAFLATSLEIRTLAIYFWLYGAFVFVLALREGLFSRRQGEFSAAP